MQCEGRVRFVVETPEQHNNAGSQAYIEQELNKPSKAWVVDVLESKRECESVKLRTADFVLLPDTNASRRQSRPYPQCRHASRSPPDESEWPLRPLQGLPRWASAKMGARTPASPPRDKNFNWLAIVADPSLRSVRDLRGKHAAMIERLYEECLAVIKKEFGVDKKDVMAFANYPPSVYKLHFHFCAPFFTSSAYDAFRMHPVSAIINNLKVCPDYYKLSTFYIPVHASSDLYRAVGAGAGEEDTDIYE